MITLWTDGSCAPKNPGPGGWVVLREREGKFSIVDLGAENPSTNIKMEGAALRAALRFLAKEGEEGEIHTDSQFWVNVLTEWAPGWAANDWRRRSGKPIENLELVQELYGLYGQVEAELVFGYGHVGVEGNELADKWANKAREGMTMEQLKNVAKEAAA